MGEIAQDYYTGYCCCECSRYFKGPHGYPVLCHDCWDSATKKEQSETARATMPELFDDDFDDDDERVALDDDFDGKEGDDA